MTPSPLHARLLRSLVLLVSSPLRQLLTLVSASSDQAVIAVHRMHPGAPSLTTVSASPYGLMRTQSAERLSDAHLRRVVLAKSLLRASLLRASRASGRTPTTRRSKHVATISVAAADRGRPNGGATDGETDMDVETDGGTPLHPLSPLATPAQAQAKGAIDIAFPLSADSSPVSPQFLESTMRAPSFPASSSLLKRTVARAAETS